MAGIQDSRQAVLPSKPPCIVCHDLDPNQFPNLQDDYPGFKPEAAKHWFRVWAAIVKRSSKAGCHFCYIIYQAYQRFGLDKIRRVDPDWDQETRVSIYFHKVLMVAFVSETIQGPDGMIDASQPILRGRCDLFVKPDKPSPWPMFKPAYEVAPVLHSNRRQKVVKGWLSSCLSQHERCSKPFCGGKYDTAMAPKRLLDLGKNPRMGVKLVDASLDTKPYAAVVHSCVQQLEPPMAPTRGENLEERKQKIQWWQIPKAIQETLIVADEQGIRYVWVKDFCVVQDDDEDCNWHIYREDIIFRGSFLTIAITGLKDLRHSSFGPRTVISSDVDPKKTPECFPIPVNHRGRDYTIYARDSMYHAHQLLREERHYYGRRTRDEMISIFGNDSSFQGIALSPRVLHLRNSEMVWECQEDQRCECMAETHNHQLDRKMQCTWDKTPGHLELNGMMVDEVFRGVMHLPCERDDRQLTLSAFFRHLSQLSAEAEDPKSRVHWVAGISMSEDNATKLPYDLLWSVGRLHDDSGWPIQHRLSPKTSPDYSPMKSIPYYAPSWSWTSMQFSKGEKLLTAEDICWPSSAGALSPAKDFKCNSVELVSRNTMIGHHVTASTSYSTDMPLPSDGVFKPHLLHLQGNIMPVELDSEFVTETSHEDAKIPSFNMSTKHIGLYRLDSEPFPGAEFRPDCNRLAELYLSRSRAKQHLDLVVLLLGSVKAFFDGRDPPTDDVSGEGQGMDVGLVLSEICNPESGQPVRKRLGVFTVPHTIEGGSWFEILKIKPTAVSIE
ncbi:tol protein [Colletotrichum chrysophilum]|uniref:Tol protein n=1 Tax=Colletotrichum chrysophilum TaxID=1836956 RepID=A0AAD9ATX9_9PEZI|nr:tol protein [Colletotrichum chrysophilum]